MNLPWAALLLVVVALPGCGGAVDLGGNGAADAQGGAQEGGGDPADDSSVAGERVFAVEDVAWGTLAVSEADVILGGMQARGEGGLVYRCDKNRCESTLERKAEGRGWFSLQMYDGRLAGGRGQGDDLRSFGTYALPGMTSEQVAIRDLPNPRDPLFYEGFVYWTLGNDDSSYRCALPSCPEGPERLGRGSGDLVKAGEYLFWSASVTAVYRARLTEPGAPEALLLDEKLSLAPEGIGRDRTTGKQLLAGTNSHFYAAFAEETDDVEYLDPSIVSRWPAGGGPRETVLDSDEPIESLFAFGHELAWVARSESYSELYSCDPSSCDETRRSLGTVMFGSRAVTADATHLYWLAASPPAEMIEGGPLLREREVRRVALIAPRQ